MTVAGGPCLFPKPGYPGVRRQLTAGLAGLWPAIMCAGTTTTGHSAWLTTLVVTEPSLRWGKPPAPHRRADHHQVGVS